MHKGGNSGIGVLILLIAAILMAVIATAILIQTAGSLQEKSVRSSEDTQNQIVTATQVMEISGTDGINGNVKWIQYTTKLVPGSEPIDLKNALLTINLHDTNFIYEFAGRDATTDNAYNGYYTWDMETLRPGDACGNDYDLDGLTDYVIEGMNGDPVMLSISADNITLGYCDSGTWESLFGDMTYLSAATGNCIGDDVANVTLTPTNYSKGYFSVEYVQQAVNNVPGHLMNGDVIKVFLEAPRNLTADEIVKFNFVPRIGAPTYTMFRMPKIIASSKVYLYP